MARILFDVQAYQLDVIYDEVKRQAIVVKLYNDTFLREVYYGPYRSKKDIAINALYEDILKKFNALLRRMTKIIKSIK